MIQKIFAKIKNGKKLLFNKGLVAIPYIFTYSIKRWLFSPVVTAYYNGSRGDSVFRYKKKNLKYFYHSYNMTWDNSRAIEVPIVMSYINKHKKDSILEAGNVLKHYYPLSHTVVDKYEKAKNIINKDILDIDIKKKYSLVVSISTLEHVGQDEESRDPKKAVTAVERLKKILKKDGILVATLPYGHNKSLDSNRNKLFSNIVYYKKVGMNWKEISEKVLLKSDTTPSFGVPYKYVYIAEYINKIK